MHTRSDPLGIPATSPQSTAAAFGAIYMLILRSQTTRARTGALVGLGLLFMIVGWIVGNAPPPIPTFDDPSPLPHGIVLVTTVGLPFVTPVTALLFAAAALGDPAEDGTLVYLWLRPVPRWVTALAAIAASLTVSIPLVIPAITLGTALTDESIELTKAAALASTVALVAYVPLFVWLGLRAKRAVLWGLAFILIWESVIAQASDGVARFSVSGYAASIIAQGTDIKIDRAAIDMPAAVIIPVLIGVAATMFTVRRLRRQDIA